MPYLTGNATDDKVWLCFPVPDDTVFIANVIGLFAVMLNDWAWEKQGSATVEQSAAYARYALDNYLRSPELSLIQDVRLNADGELEKMVGGVWMAAGDHVTPDQAQASTLPAGQPATAQIDGSTFLFGIPQGDAGEAGQDGSDGQSVTDLEAFTLAAGLDAYAEYNAVTGVGTLYIPKGDKGDQGSNLSDFGQRYIGEGADQRDAVCYAAQTLAESATDTFQDFMEVFDATATIVIENAGLITRLVAGALTFNAANAIVEPVIEFFTEASTFPAVDYARQNARDPEVIDEAAKIFFCAMDKAWQDGNIDNILPYITLELVDEVIIDIYESVTDPAVWEGTGLGDALAYAFTQLQTEVLAQVCVAYYIGHTGLFGDALGLIDPMATIARGAMSRAEYFDSRDCAGYECDDNEWTHTFNFASGKQGWLAADELPDGTLYASGGSVWSGSSWDSKAAQFASNANKINWIQNSETGYNLTDVEVIFDAVAPVDSGVQLGGVFRILDSTTERLINSQSGVSTGENVRSWSGDISVQNGIRILVQWYRQGSTVDGSSSIKEVTFSGTGNNPFE